MTHLHPAPDPSELGGSRWNTFAAGQTVTAVEFLAGAAPLLQATVAVVQPGDPHLFARGQFAATLSLDARETSLRLPRDAAAPGTRQIAAQAERIGAGIIDLLEAVLERVLADPIPLPAGPVEIRSTCDNHLWTHEVTDLLTNPVPMQLFNEFLHQVILLRDALLPFTNWDEVRIPVDEGGLRATEPAREAFLTEVLVRSTRHSAIVGFARSVLTGDATDGDKAYGFDYTGGRVLPAVATAPLASAPTHLLTWHPAAPGADPRTGVVGLVPATGDYYAADRWPLDGAVAGPGDGASDRLASASAQLVDSESTDGARTVAINVQRGADEARIDLGDALRGHRFAYVEPDDAEPGTDSGGHGTERHADAARVDAETPLDPWSVLATPGLGHSETGTWSIDARGASDLVQLALLGRLYPENVILATGREAGTPTTVGKRGPARVIVDR